MCLWATCPHPESLVASGSGHFLGQTQEISHAKIRAVPRFTRIRVSAWLTTARLRLCECDSTKRILCRRVKSGQSAHLSPMIFTL
jgi:hypothetical protein